MNINIRSTFTGAIAVCATFFSFPAAAQSFDTTGYATLGYSVVQAANLTNGAVTGRVGVRFGSYFGAEGELDVGVTQDRFGFSLCPDPKCLVLEFLVRSKLRDAEAIYAVGFLPITPDADLFIRAGYGVAQYSTHPVPSSGFNEESLNFGLGGDYFFDGSNGIRFDYTRYDNLHQHNLIAREAVGGGTNVWSAAYILRF